MAAEPTKYTSKLKGIRVLVVGGSSGIGFGVAEGAIESGAADVIISSSSPQRVADAVKRIEKDYPSAKGRVRGVVAALGNGATLESEISRMVSEATNGGAAKLDHVVFTAGDGLAMAPVESFSLEKMQQAGMVRFFAPLLLAKYLRANLNPGPASSYTLTAGGIMDQPQKDWTVVGAFASGLGGMMRGLALDLAPIRVNLISPGAVETELWNAFREQGTYDAIKAQFESGMTTKTIGKIEDVAEQYLTMMKDKNMSGSIVSTNGGSFLL